MTAKLKLTHIKPEDIEELVGMFMQMEYLHAEMYPDWYAKPSDSVEVKIRKEIGRITPASRHQILIAKIRKKIIGFCSYGIERDGYHNAIQKKYCDVYELYVSEKFRKKGYASEMLKKLESICLAKGIKGMLISSAASNQVANDFYQKKGYSLLTTTFSKIIS